jgi:hypothetical protein
MNESLYFEGCVSEALLADQETPTDPPALVDEEKSGKCSDKGVEVDHAVDEQLDDVLARYMGARERVQGLRTELAGTLGKGWFKLAQARFRSDRLVLELGEASYAMREQIEPRVRCSVQWDEESATVEPMALAHTHDNSSNGNDSQDTNDAVVSTLSRRKHKEGERKKKEKKEKKESPPEKEQEEEGKASVGGDPVQWFGRMLPVEVSVAQRAFTSSLSLAVQLANAQNELRALETRFSALRTTHTLSSK